MQPHHLHLLLLPLPLLAVVPLVALEQQALRPCAACHCLQQQQQQRLWVHLLLLSLLVQKKAVTCRQGLMLAGLPS